MSNCPACRRDHDILCVTVSGQRVLALDGEARVRVLVNDPMLVAEAGALVQDALDRLQAVVNEATAKSRVYAHMRDALVAAARKGASA